MTITGEDQDARGRVLLLAAAPHRSRRRLLDPEHGTSVLAAVPTARLLPAWRGPVDLVQLVDPADPQAVLARLQDAAAAAGPLLVYVCGQLTRDRRQRQVHLALARTTESTLRYTALPWAWLARTLSSRAPGTTTVVVDLIADPSCLPMQEADLQLPDQVLRFGVVAPPVRRGPLQPPAYTQQLAQLLRTGPGGQQLAELHPLAASQAALEEGTVVLAPPPPAQAPLPRPLPPPLSAPAPAAGRSPAAEPVADLRPAIAEAIRSGRHPEAAELARQWEHAVLRAHGHLAPEMADVAEVQATVAAAVGAEVEAADRWTATAERRLRLADPAAQAAARNALALWRRLDEEEIELESIGQRLAIVLQAIGRTSAAAAVRERLAQQRIAYSDSEPSGSALSGASATAATSAGTPASAAGRSW